MHTVYLVCFLVGLGLSVVLAALGNLHFGHVGHGAHHGGHGPHHAAHGTHQAGTHHAQHGTHVSASGHWIGSILGFSLGLLSPIALAGAALLFGGAGLLAGSGSIGLAVAIVAGLAGAVLLRALLGALEGSSTAPLQLTAEGAIGVVNATIRPDRSGEVVYTLEGLHRSLPARSVDGIEIPRGTQVVITQREGGFAWVQPLEPLDR